MSEDPELLSSPQAPSLPSASDFERASAHLAAIVESSDDAIVGKTLQGIVTSWNAGAERLFGWTAAEMIGQPILKIIPQFLQHEENIILGKLRAGERIQRYETWCTTPGRTSSTATTPRVGHRRVGTSPG